MKETTVVVSKTNKTEKTVKAASTPKDEIAVIVADKAQVEKTAKVSVAKKSEKVERRVAIEKSAVMVNTTKVDKPKKARISKGLATHNRRMKQESRRESLPVSSKK